MQTDNGQPYAEDEDTGWVYDPRYEILEPVILRIAAEARRRPYDLIPDKEQVIEFAYEFAVEIIDALDECGSNAYLFENRN